MKLKIITLVFFCSVFLVSAQDKFTYSFNNTALSEVLSILENDFNIKFSYNSELVENKLVTIENRNLMLAEVLSLIELQTNIKFTELSQRYYILKRKRSITDTQNLEQVVINEYVTSGIKKTSNEAIIVSSKKLGILPGLTEPDVLQSIQIIPGIQSPNETASGLYIRGGTPDQNLILWDGIKMYHSGHFFGTISAFNPYITESVQLYKNGTKAQYGSRISGVIDITSEDDIPSKLEGGAGFNLTHADAFIKAPLSEKFAIIVSGRRSFAEVFETPTFQNLAKRVFQNTKISEGNKVLEDDEFLITKDLFYFTDITLKTIFKPDENNKITFSNLLTKNKLDYGFLIEEFEEASQDNLNIDNFGSSLSWQHKYSNSFSHNFNAYYSNYELNYRGTNNISNELLNELDRQNTINDFGLSLGTSWKLNPENKLNLGYQFSSNKVNYNIHFKDTEEEEASFNRQDDGTNKTHAFYADYNYKSKKKWFFNLGVRANYISIVDKIFTEPRVQLGFDIGRYVKLIFSTETLHQPVNQIIEFRTVEFGLENQAWALANNEDSPVLKNNQFTSGITFRKSGWNLNVDAYYKNIKGITSFASGFDRIGEPDLSEGRSKVFGVDVLLKKRINNYRTWLSYSYIKNRFSFDSLNNGEDFPGNFDITNQFSWAHSYTWNKFDASVGWTIRTGIPFTNALGVTEEDGETFINYEPINSSRLSNYHRLDISANYRFNFSEKEKLKGKLGISLVNIYDRENELSKTFRRKQNIVSGEDVLRQIDNVSLGFTPNMVFRIEF